MHYTSIMSAYKLNIQTFQKDGSERKVTEISYEDFCEKIENTFVI